MTLAASPDLYRRITEAVSRLITTRQLGETMMVSLPVMYPSGTFVGVNITVSGDRCFVSDSALGLREAEMAGAGDFFDSAARQAAQAFGVSYDGASVFVASAPLSRIDGAVIAVANASSNAVSRALLRASEAKELSRNSTVYDLLSEIFGRRNVSKHEEIAGKEDNWPVHNVVTLKGRRAIFEFVGSHTNSIASKFLMFSDIMHIEDPPSRNSVVTSLVSIGRRDAMLQDVSNVLELQASQEEFRRYAEAA